MAESRGTSEVQVARSRHLPTRIMRRGKGSSLIAGPNEKEGIQMQNRGRVHGQEEKALNVWENSDQLYIKIHVFFVLPKVTSVLFPRAL